MILTNFINFNKFVHFIKIWAEGSIWKILSKFQKTFLVLVHIYFDILMHNCFQRSFTYTTCLGTHTVIFFLTFLCSTFFCLFVVKEDKIFSAVAVSIFVELIFKKNFPSPLFFNDQTLDLLICSCDWQISFASLWPPDFAILTGCLTTSPVCRHFYSALSENPTM